MVFLPLRADSKIPSLTDMCFSSLPSIKCSAAPSSFRLLPFTVSLSELMLNDLHDYRALGSGWKLRRAAEHLIDGSG